MQLQSKANFQQQGYGFKSRFCHTELASKRKMFGSIGINGVGANATGNGLIIIYVCDLAVVGIGIEPTTSKLGLLLFYDVMLTTA